MSALNNIEQALKYRSPESNAPWSYNRKVNDATAEYFVAETVKTVNPL